MSDGIADFSEGRYYDRFSGPEALSPDNLRGLENEREGARIQDFYLPLLSRRPLVSRADRNLRVLDSGCGNGESVDVLNAAGFDAWGHDLSALRRWQWRLRERRDRLVVADGASLPFPDGFFDAVIASGVLEHIGVAEEGAGGYRVRPLSDRDSLRQSFLRELVRVSSPGGRILLDFPNGNFPIDFWHGDRPGGARVHSLREGFLPTAREVRSLCRRIHPALRVRPLSPLGRLRFRQVSAHWYGRLLRGPMHALQRVMSLPGLGFLAASPLNPYLILEVRRRTDQQQ
ncbi:MAG: class I SAM-dependent methyltransferase [Acidobacteriota bacterium]